MTARGELDGWTGKAGDAAGARDLYAALLPILERVQGPDHPGTLIARGNLAGWTGKAGDAAGARDLYAALLPILERVQGDCDADTLATRHQLLRWTGKVGNTAPDASSSEKLQTTRQASNCLRPRSRHSKWHLLHCDGEPVLGVQALSPMTVRPRYVSSQMRHRVLLFPKLPPGADAALCHFR